MSRKHDHRRNYRQQSHQESHTSGEIKPVLQGNPYIPTGEAKWVDTNEGVVAVCDDLKSSKIFSFDTEFIGEDSYFAKTCLIQVSTANMVALIDPFAASDLTPLYELLCDPLCTKVVHAGKQDFEPLARLYGKPPAAVFDTQLAAGLIGFPWPISLTKLIDALLQHDVGGHFTLTQWDARPLTKRQLSYAADDVRYLLAIHEIIQTRLDALERLDWVEEECRSLTSPKALGFDLETSVKRICKNKNPRKKELLRIQALVTLRDSIAQKQNEPPRSVIPDDCIIAIARKPADTSSQLASMKGFPKHIAMKFGNDIIQSIVDAQHLSPISLRKPHPIEKEANTRQELDGLWSLFCAWCVGNELSPGLVASRTTFTDWCLAIRADSLPEDSTLTSGWREKVISPFSLFMQGKEELEFSREITFKAKAKE